MIFFPQVWENEVFLSGPKEADRRFDDWNSK